MGDDSLYWLNDRFSTSPAEDARNKYRDSINDTEDAVQSINDDIQVWKQTLEVDFQKYYGATVGDASSGLFRDGFEAALDRWKASVDSLLRAFDWALTDLRDQLAEMRRRKAVLDNMCVEEDYRKRQFDASEIPF
jgi:hypothetical protein